MVKGLMIVFFWLSLMSSAIGNPIAMEVYELKDEKDIFTLIGGSGTQVIRRYLDESFGLDFYSRIVDSGKDLILSAKFRGMTGNLAGGEEVYRSEQKLVDTLAFGRLFKEIRFEINEANRKQYFSFIGEGDEKSLKGAAGSAFQIKSQIDFDQTHRLIETIIEIIEAKKIKSLGSFSEIKSKSKIEDLYKPLLIQRIRDDMVIRFSEGGYRDGMPKFDFDFGHPTQFLEFYECDNYIVTLKDEIVPIVSTENREKIYEQTLKYISEQENIKTLFDFKRVILGAIVEGHRNNRKPIKAPFIQFVSCELEDEHNRPIFHIDKYWYKVEDNFIEDLNSNCEILMENSRLRKDILPLIWEDAKNVDEDKYNLKYLNHENYIVLDKVLGQNIELCDILYFEKEEIYLIHVKKGFNAKMRDLTNQIKISSQRLWTDKSDKLFLKEVYRSYQSSSNFSSNKITEKDFLNLFSRKINYVLAFTSTLKDYTPIFDNLRNVKSNIAKFSIIQSLGNSIYPISIFEIKGG
jgi:hypothetical protein